VKTTEVTIVKIYLIEGSTLLNKILNYLQNDGKVRGLSVFRAVKGFGETGNHTSSIMDLSFTLPMVVEFFDTPEKIEKVVAHLSKWIKPHHLLFFSGKTNA